MTSKELKDLVRNHPFEPFIIHMDDGAEYSIQHPDGVVVGNYTAIVATKRPPEPGENGEADEGDRFMYLSIKHISRVEKTVQTS